jgi:hypothetical protein
VRDEVDAGDGGVKCVTHGAARVGVMWQLGDVHHAREASMVNEKSLRRLFLLTTAALVLAVLVSVGFANVVG